MIDQKDLEILELLKNDSGLSSQKISAMTRIPATTVHHRIRRLKNMGVIKNYTVNLDYKKLGKELEAYILVIVDYRLLKEKGMTQHKLAENLRKQKFVEEAAMITGVSDIILRVRVSNISQLEEFVTKYLRNVDGIEKTQTSVVLSSF